MNLENITKDTRLKDLAKEYPWLIDEVKKLSSQAAKIPSPMIKMILAKASISDVADKVNQPADKLIEMLSDLITKHEGKAE